MSAGKREEVSKTAFSKTLLIQESALIWILSLGFLALSFFCVKKGYTGSLPWLAVALSGAWTAYGVSQAMYYRKSEKENTEGGIIYETAMQKIAKTNSRIDCEEEAL